MIIHHVLHLIHANVLDVDYQYDLISSPLPCCISLQSPLSLLWRLQLPLTVNACSPFFGETFFLSFFCDSALSLTFSECFLFALSSIFTFELRAHYDNPHIIKWRQLAKSASVFWRATKLSLLQLAYPCRCV